jgi:hypothetical protein
MFLKKYLFVNYKSCFKLFLIIYLVSYLFLPTTALVSDQPDFQYYILDENNNGRVAIGDIDGDGKNDIVVHTYDKKITWYKYPNWEQITIVANNDIRGDDIILVDLDNDGDLDIVCGFDNEGNNIWWFENPLPNGDPEWENWVGYMIGSGHINLKDLRVLDLDLDGKIDVAARHRDRLYIYFQNTSTDWEQKILDIREREGMDVGDIDHDGDDDIVLNGFWLENPDDPRNDDWPEHSIDSLWYQQTGGGWRDNACKVQVADINQDGCIDVVFSQSEKTEYPVAWYETTNPKGGDSAWAQHIIGYVDNCHTLQVADMDNDGDLDIVAGRLRDDPFLPLFIFYNKGDGIGWDQVQIYEGGCYSGKVGDIDNDGDIDFISSRTWLDAPVYILRNPISGTPIGTWERHVIDSSKPWSSVFIVPGDINGDGLPDIVTGGWWYQNPGTPGGIWTRHDIGDPLKNMAVVFDFDKDGDLDILGTEGQGSSSNDSFVWARNDGSGSFTILDNVENGDGDFLQGAAIARFSSGGPLEVALSWHEEGKGIQMLVVPSDPSGGAWTLKKIHDDSQDEQLSAGDIDQDGDIDLLQGTKWLRDDGVSWKQFLLSDEIGNPDRNRLADIDGDGRLDAVVGFEAISTPGKLAWYKQPSTSPIDIWTEHIISKTVVGPMSLDVADMDSDGDLDIIVGEHNLDNPSSAKLYIFENADGKGLSWNQHLLYTGDEHHDGAQMVDIDNDGDLDIISIGWGHDLVVLYENKANKGDGLTRAPVNLVRWWRLDENNGLTATDAVGYNNGTLVNGPEWRPSDGKIRGALAFDGFDDRVDLGTIDVEGGIGLTITFWFKADNFDTPDARFISKATGLENDQHYWMVSTFDEGALRFRLKTDGSTDVLISNSGEIQPSQWYHVAATYDGSQMRIYKNAIEIASRDKSGNIDTNPIVYTAIGNQPSGAGSRAFDGIIDDFRIYNRALSISEIQNLMKGTLNTIYLDDSFVSDNRCDVGSEQTIRFHAIDAVHGSNIHRGTIYINGEACTVNASGWATLKYTSLNVGSETFIITKVNIVGYSTFMQFAQNATIIWDRVKIIEGGASKKIFFWGKNTVVWFKAEYEYDSKKFNSSCGVLYVNGSKCSWSDIYNRWEIQISNTATGVKKYIVSGVVDNVYDLKIINTEIGLVSINHFISYAIYVIIIMMIIFIIIFIASRIRNKINLPR